MLGFQALGERALGGIPPSRAAVPVVNSTQANFTFSGATHGYPTTFAWGSPPITVTGFKAASFGLPSSLPQIASIMPVRFGTARTTALPVTGIAPVHLGTPGVGRRQPVTGISPVRFGSIILLPHVVGFKPVRLGAIALLPHAVGFKPVRFGAFTRRLASHVPGIRPCRFGTPTAPTHRTSSTQGLHAVKLGHPVAIKYLPR